MTLDRPGPGTQFLCADTPQGVTVFVGDTVRLAFVMRLRPADALFTIEGPVSEICLWTGVDFDCLWTGVDFDYEGWPFLRLTRDGVTRSVCVAALTDARVLEAGAARREFFRELRELGEPFGEGRP